MTFLLLVFALLDCSGFGATPEPRRPELPRCVNVAKDARHCVRLD
jgi:hypothetical protein